MNAQPGGSHLCSNARHPQRSMTILNQVHAHDVLDMMAASARPYSRESLIAEMAGKFGADARFHTCSASGMTADELIDFLAERRKFIGTAESFVFDTARACGHSH